MLHVGTYTQEYVEDCRSRIASQVSTYRDLLAAARERGSAGEARLESAIGNFEPLFFGNLLLALDNLFCHRGRNIEGKDGNPLNEVRVLCNSLMSNRGIMTADKTIRLKPETSILGYKVGDVIRLNEADYLRLSEAFFAEIESKYQ